MHQNPPFPCSGDETHSRQNKSNSVPVWQICRWWSQCSNLCSKLHYRKYHTLNKLCASDCVLWHLQPLTSWFRHIISHATRPYNEKWIAIPELQRQDADISLPLTSGNSVRFATLVNNPMFRAHHTMTMKDSLGNVTSYISDFPATMLGCAAQVSHATLARILIAPFVASIDTV